MALITMPSSPAFINSEWGIRRNVAVSESPFTGAQQVYAYDKAQWYCTVTLPPMLRSQAREWQAFFMKLRGRENTFLFGDPDGGTIIADDNAAPSSITAAAASKGATTLNLTIGSGKQINSGSYIQIGTNANAKLYMVVDDNTGNGNVTIEPELKADVANSSTVIFTDAKGVFRMDSNDLSWSADHIKYNGLTFSCSEVL